MTSIITRAGKGSALTHDEVDSNFVNLNNGKAESTALTSHSGNKANPHEVTKAQVGLGNVDNTSDAAKPVSTAQQAAIDAHANNKSNPHEVTKAQIGLGNVDNTSDTNKPISTAQQSALNQKANLSGDTFTGNVNVPSLNGGPLGGFRNKIIGGHFDSNPWQRGASFAITSSGTYVADRWRIDFDGAANISADRVALAAPQVINGVYCRFGLKLTINSKSGNTFMRLSQRIEGADTLTTLAATLQTAIQGSASFSIPVNARQSFGTGGSPSTDVITPMSSPLAATASMQLLGTGLTLPDVTSKTFGTGNNDFLGVEYDLMSVPVGGYIVIPLAGFEYGTKVTTWEDRRRLELQLCQRYYCTILSSAKGYVNALNDSFRAPVYWPVTMRAAPSVTNSGGSVIGNMSVAAVDRPSIYGASFALSPTDVGMVTLLERVITASAEL